MASTEGIYQLLIVSYVFASGSDLVTPSRGSSESTVHRWRVKAADPTLETGFHSLTRRLSWLMTSWEGQSNCKVHEDSCTGWGHTNQLQVEFWGHLNYFEGRVTCQQVLWYAAHSTIRSEVSFQSFAHWAFLTVVSSLWTKIRSHIRFAKRI